MNEQVFEKLREIVSDALRIPAGEITLKTNLIVDLDAESIDLVDIRFRIEEAFEFRVAQQEFVNSIAGSDPNEVMEKFAMDNIVHFVISQLAAKETK